MFLSLPLEERLKRLRSLSDDDAEAIQHCWRFNARPSQLVPPGDWEKWVILAGRGFGKTRTGAETVRQWISEGFNYVNLIGATADDARDVMVEGESGLLAICPKDERPIYKAHLSRLDWPNGAKSLIFTADSPERLRGKQHEKLWGDEVAAWRRPEAWDQAVFGLRLGRNPQAVITTTPKPSPLIRELMLDPKTHLTRGSTFDNRSNLAPAFVNSLLKKYEGTRLGRQELMAEVLTDVQGALWNMDSFHRVASAPRLSRIGIAVDPSGAKSTKDITSDEIGIVVGGVGTDDSRGYLIADLSIRAGPTIWARAVVNAYRRYGADIVVVESNYGGPMVEAILRSIDPSINVVNRTASRGKHIRAEPVAALYERGEVSHVGPASEWEQLEDQYSQFTIAGWMGSGSPDRADAAVWLLNELMIDKQQLGKSGVASAW